MKEFIEKYRDCIEGVLEGFDRVIFRGTLRSVSHKDGFGKYMNSQGILLKNFDTWAERCTKRLIQHIEGLAEAAGRPCQYLTSSAVSKEELARTIAVRDGVTEGLVCVLSCVEPCYSAEIRSDRATKKLQLIFTQRKCKFMYLIDPTFGWMHIRIQTWIPFDVQVYINGRSYLQRQMDTAGIRYVQEGNCFTGINDLSKAQRLMDRLVTMNWPSTLRRLLEPWWPASEAGLLPEGPERFYWTIRQSEVATDVMFKNAADLASIYPRLCRYAIVGLSCEDILKFMGKSPSRLSGEVTSSCQKLVQGVRIKHQVATNTIKMYDKAGSVLRIETTINNPGTFRVFRGRLDQPDKNPQWRAMAKGVADIRRRMQVCLQANARYWAALACVGNDASTAAVLDPVSRPVVQADKRERGLRPIGPDDAALFAAVMDGKNLLDGFTNGNLQTAMLPAPPKDETERRRRSNWTGRKLRLLRRHGLIGKIGARRLYRVTPKGHRVMGLALAIRQSFTGLSAVA